MLDERKAAILRAVVEEYIHTGQPVGSGHVARAPGVDVSSATVRNEMGLLESEGFLRQPHTSAGRVPTEKGYRFFVDHLRRPARLATSSAEEVRAFFARAHGEVEQMLSETSRLLSDLTHLTSVVVAPAAIETTVRSVQLVGLSTTSAVLVAVLSDRVRYETAVKALIFIPMAISFVAAGVIWNFMYDFDPNIGTVNAAAGALGGEPQSWFTEWPRNTFMLIIVGIWMWVGFAMVILSAGLKGISTELLEAARMDGANEFQVFFRIIVPLLAPTIAVVGTTIVIVALKTFDIVWVMTGGQFDTDVIGTLFYEERFTNRDAGAASAVAVILLLTIIPVMLLNIRRFQAQEASR